jgi:hypothetical protein
MADKKHNALIQKLWKDAKFKGEFLKDPKKHLGEAFGAKLPDDMKVEVVQETKGKHYFVIPVNPADYGKDLSDAQLEEVAGGTMGIGATITFGTVTAC